MRFAALDWLVVGAYFAALLGIAAWVARRRQQTAADYFLAGRHVGWFAIGASIFASNIGSEHVVGLATERPDPVRLTGLTFGGPPSEDAPRERTWTTGDLVQSAAIVLLVAAVLVYFS